MTWKQQSDAKVNSKWSKTSAISSYTVGQNRKDNRKERQFSYCVPLEADGLKITKITTISKNDVPISGRRPEEG